MHGVQIVTLLYLYRPHFVLLVSYYGCLDAVVNKNYDSGVDLCKTAIEIIKEEVSWGREG